MADEEISEWLNGANIDNQVFFDLEEGRPESLSDETDHTTQVLLSDESKKKVLTLDFHIAGG